MVAGNAGGWVSHQRAVRPWSRPAPRALRSGMLITTFRCVATTRCGAFVAERRVVVGDEGGPVY